MTVQNAGSVLQDLVYTRVATGRIDTIYSTQRLSDSWSYGYDTLDRLLQAGNYGLGSLTQYFMYDAAHNMTYNSAVGNYAYPAPTAARPHAVTTAGSYGYTYDAAGNALSKSGLAISNVMTWDNFFVCDRLRRAEARAGRKSRATSSPPSRSAGSCTTMSTAPIMRVASTLGCT